MKGKWIYLLLASLIIGGCGDVSEISLQPRSELPPTPSASPSLPGQSTAFTHAPFNVFFSSVWETVSHNRNNPQNIAHCCAAVIDGARQSLDICCQEVDNQIIIDAIVRAHRRGVQVRFVGEGDYADESGPIAFRNAGIPMIFDTRDALMHNKFMVIDQRAVWTGSFNFTENCAYKNNNNAVLIHDERVAANFSEKFRWFWEEQKFGGRPSRRHKIPYPVVKTSDGATIETYFSTHDDVDHKVIAALEKAKKSIDFLAFSFTHDDIARVMIERAAQGVTVRGVFEDRQNSKYSEFERMEGKPNVHVLLDGNRFQMHHKFIVIDKQTVITGSFNFSTSASSDNDENVVFIHDPAVADRFAEEFAAVFTDAQRAIAGHGGGLLRR